MTAVTRVAVVPHTHWDREWYAPFETFRGRLVELMDDLLPLLESDPGYRHFLLDGQLAVVDDYVSIRPEAEETLRRLVAAGRVAVGPWYTLPDEFCVSGETLVRDLQLGLRRAERLGGAMAVGYLPDMFGHVAQMPQLLRLAGMETAVVWRGVPEAIDRTAFRWSAPDGSTVRAEYLWHGYGIGADVENDPDALASRLKRLRGEIGDRLVGDLLFLNGTDHQSPQPWLPAVVERVNAAADDLEVEIVDLAEALRRSAAHDGELPQWDGELRSGAHANLLMGVASNRVDVKQAAAAAERELERVAEPLAALWMPPQRWPASLLDAAWLDVVRNAAHDSICACSADEVCAAVLARYRSARRTAEAVTGHALAAAARQPAEPGLIVVNPSPWSRGGVVEVVVPGEGPAPGAQILEARPAVVSDEVLAGDAARAWLAGWRSQQLDATTYLEAVEVAESDAAVELTLHVAGELRTNILVPEVAADVAARLSAGPERPLRVRVVQSPTRRLLCEVTDVPGYGWCRWVPGPVVSPPVEVRGDRITNGLVEVVIDRASATFSLGPVAGLGMMGGFGRLVDSGDCGDTYNYCPPADDLVVADPVDVEVTALESGPLRARVDIAARYELPEEVHGRGRRGCVPTVVVTTLEVVAGEPWVRVLHRWENRSRDHRVRALLPLPTPADASTAETAFGVVTRGLRAEGGPTERALATFPSRRFVCAGGLVVTHDGLLEYELTAADGSEIPAGAGRADALALTLLRSTGMLSRVEHAYRPLPAGPPLPVPGAQLFGPVEARYAVAAAGAVDPWSMADEVFVPLQLARAPGGGPVAAGSQQALAVDGAVISALVRDAGSLVVRAHNPREHPAELRLPGQRGWTLDLRGRPLSQFEEAVTLRPDEIVTVRLAAAPHPEARATTTSGPGPAHSA